jgi:uncharacterized OB-fold protein
MTMTELPRARTFLLADGKLHLRHCAACARYYPAWMVICAGCGDTALPTRPASGHGEVRSWVTYRRQYSLPFDLPVPYTVVLVELAEGVRVNGLWHAAAPDGLALGAPVVLAKSPDRPVFAPVAGGGAGARH